MLFERYIIKSKYLTKVFEASSDYAEWFGYYNYDPLNYNQTKLLCNKSPKDGVKVQTGMKIELGYYDITSGEWYHIGESDSWNWQQAAMMQWLPGKGNENKVIYNTSRDNRLVSIIHDIENGLDRVIDYPIYGLTPDGKKSISIDIERSYWCRAYHYQSVLNVEKDGPVYAGDGIFEVDLENNTSKRIISIQNIINTDARPYFKNMKHWIEHVMVNPSGTRFCFLHRFSPIDNIYAYKTRLCVADIDGNNIQVIEGWDNLERTHFGWKGDDEFSIYTYQNNRYGNPRSFNEILHTSPLKFGELFVRVILSISYRLPKCIQKIITGRKSYYEVFSFDGKQFIHSDVYTNRTLDMDGHPSFTKDGEFMITDTYPNKKHIQTLQLLNCRTHKYYNIGSFYAFYHGNPASCDLHPKLCANNDYIMVDSAYNKRHHLILFKINWELIKNGL